MKFTYKTNGAETTKSLTEWYFGKRFVSGWTDTLKKLNASDGRNEIKVWQIGTGYLTITII